MVEYHCRRKRAFDEEKSNKTKEQITGVGAPEYPSVASPEDEEEGS